ncbi:hypothetical protein J5226_00655 [Lysobacter sp. K5869]|uniref:hypothetical protein n=1 Tax=Lysobacter sp. K5869 TaxID=2820808 RepID=UPI001C063B4B|nr:hypothetical protein [Lysobacter sp. K5869]QWP76953.1 hypothetical protein J5226_00655 [Lysobacter sp. K5869]
MNASKDDTAGDGGYEEVQGVLVARDAGGAWRYRPCAPGVARGGDGRAQFSLIGAGPVTMLALTASWGVPSAALDAVRAELAARAQVPPAQLSLSPEPVEVGSVRLMLGDGAGGFEELAKAQSSGAPPYHAAFNLMLTAEQAAKVRKALAGERGWLELRYEASDALAARRASSAQTEESLSVDAALRDAQGEAGMSAKLRYSERVEADSGRPEPSIRSYSADAADWGLPKQ